MAHYLGLDLGGTNVKAGVVSDDARVRSRVSVPTEADGGPDRVIVVMIDAARRAASEAGLPLESIAGIGIGAPGPLDFDAGVIKAAPNLPGFRDVPLRDRIASGTGVRTVLENDANAAAFGEYWAGAGRDASIRNLVMLTLGTGIGSGLVVDGRLVHGGFGLGGEGGHIIVQPDGRRCGCGQRGCLEAYASASSTARRAAEALAEGAASRLRSMIADGGEPTARQVFEAAAAGDGLAERLVDDTARYLGLAAVTLCRLLDPQMIVFAGGMALAGDQLFGRVRAAFLAESWELTVQQVRIVPAELGNDAGFIGAAAVVREAGRPAA